MTDRHTAYLVTLQQVTREDDACDTITAIRQIKGVLDVRPVIAGMEQLSAAIRVDNLWRREMGRLIANGVEWDSE